MLLMVVLPNDVAGQLEPANEDVHAAAVARRRAAPQPLGLEVVAVDLPGAEEEVIGIDAAPLVAAMAEDLARGDRPVFSAPGQAMGEPWAIAITRRAVALPLRRRLPDPAARDRIAAAVMGDALLDRPAVRAFEAHQPSPPPRPSRGRITTSPTISWPR